MSHWARDAFRFLGEMGCYSFLSMVGETAPPHEEFEKARASGKGPTAGKRASRKLEG